MLRIPRESGGYEQCFDRDFLHSVRSADSWQNAVVPAPMAVSVIESAFRTGARLVVWATIDLYTHQVGAKNSCYAFAVNTIRSRERLEVKESNNEMV